MRCAGERVHVIIHAVNLPDYRNWDKLVLTEKGHIRVELERRLEVGNHSGAPVLIIRFGHFFGPGPGNSWFSQWLVTPGKRLTAIIYPGTRGVGWAYLPEAR
jgi:hypothetical protein